MSRRSTCWTDGQTRAFVVVSTRQPASNKKVVWWRGRRGQRSEVTSSRQRHGGKQREKIKSSQIQFVDLMNFFCLICETQSNVCVKMRRAAGWWRCLRPGRMAGGDESVALQLVSSGENETHNYCRRLASNAATPWNDGKNVHSSPTFHLKGISCSNINCTLKWKAY